MKLFLTAPDTNATTDAARWWQGLRNQCRRTMFTRAMEQGELQDKSETPLYLKHIREITQHYALDDASPGEAAQRKFSLKTLWQAAGRSSEVAWTTVDGMQWDDHFKCVIIEVPQGKAGKVKLIMLLVGLTAHDCWFIDFADYLAIGPRLLHDDDGANWLMPHLQDRATPARVLGRYVKEVFEHLSAGGVRPGAANVLCAKMPAELVVQATGHDLRTVSALYEYVDASRACQLTTL